MQHPHEEFVKSLPIEDLRGLFFIQVKYWGLGIGLPAIALGWASWRHGLTAAVDLFLHPATLLAGATFYVLVPMVLGLMVHGATAAQVWSIRDSERGGEEE